MRYMTVAEASQKWGVSLRQIQRLVSEKRIPGAKKFGRAWMLPEDTAKPPDLRHEKKQPAKTLASDLAHVIAATAVSMPSSNPDSILDTVTDRRLQLQYEGELAYLRGDFQQVMRCFSETEGDDAARLRACPCAIAATVSLGDYRTYAQIDAYLKEKAGAGGGVSAFAELALATAAVSVIAPNMTPEWLKTGDFSALAPEARQNALHLRAKLHRPV